MSKVSWNQITNIACKWAIPPKMLHRIKKRNLPLRLILWFILNLMPWMFKNLKGLSNSLKKNFKFRWFPWDLKPSLKLHMWDWRQKNSLKCKLHGVLSIFFLTNFAKGKKINTFLYSRGHEIFNQLQRGVITSGQNCHVRYATFWGLNRKQIATLFKNL